MRIEVRLPPKNLSSDLLFLDLNSRLLMGPPCQIAQQLAKGFGAVQGVARDQPLHSSLQLGLFGHDYSGYIDVTGAYQLAHLLASPCVTSCNRIKRTETCTSLQKS